MKTVVKWAILNPCKCKPSVSNEITQTVSIFFQKERTIRTHLLFCIYCLVLSGPFPFLGVKVFFHWFLKTVFDRAQMES